MYVILWVMAEMGLWICNWLPVLDCITLWYSSDKKESANMICTLVWWLHLLFVYSTHCFKWDRYSLVSFLGKIGHRTNFTSPGMNLFHIPQCSIQKKKYAHFCSEWCNVGYGTGAFWDLLIRPIQLYQSNRCIVLLPKLVNQPGFIAVIN